MIREISENKGKCWSFAILGRSESESVLGQSFKNKKTALQHFPTLPGSDRPDSPPFLVAFCTDLVVLINRCCCCCSYLSINHLPPFARKEVA